MDMQPIYQALALFKQQGVSPSLAQLKSKLPRSYPLPVLINILKRYQHDDSWLEGALTQPVSPAQTSEKNNSTEQRIEQLETTVSDLKLRLSQLEQQLQMFLAKES